MKSIYMNIVKQNMLMTSELIKVLKLLEENDIEAIPFKGPILSELAYGDVISRQYVDLDILIKEKDLEKVYDLLVCNNFNSMVKKEFINNKLFLEKNSDITFVNENNGINIEIHWKLFRTKFSSKLNNENFFDGKHKIKINNDDINVFNAEILLVYLCMHGSKHKWERIEWISDIDKLLSKEQNINWKVVLEIAKSSSCLKMLYLGLYISYLLFDTSISNINGKELEKQTYKNMINHIFKEITNINNLRAETDKNLDSIKFHYHLNETFFEKIKFLKKTFLEISDNDTKNFNSNNILFHYIIKLKRLFKKYL